MGFEDHNGDLYCDITLCTQKFRLIHIDDQYLKKFVLSAETTIACQATTREYCLSGEGNNMHSEDAVAFPISNQGPT